MEEKLDKLNMKMNILFKKISRIEDKLNEIGLNEILIEFSNFYFEKRLKNKNYYKSLEKHLSKYYYNEDKSEDSEIFSNNSNKSKKKKLKKKKTDPEDSDNSISKKKSKKISVHSEESNSESEISIKKSNKKKKDKKESSNDSEEIKKSKKTKKRRFSSSSDEEDRDKKKKKRRFCSSSDEEDRDEEDKDKKKKRKNIQSPLILNLDSLIIGKNEEYNKTLKGWINSNKNINSKLLYRMSKDGNNFNNFHSLCDNQGPTLTLLKLTNQDIIGLYTPLSWDKKSNRKTDSQIFIFSLTKKYKIQSEIYCSEIQGPSSEYIKFQDKGMNYITFYGNNPDIINRFQLKGNYANSEVEVFKIIIE